MPVSTSENPCPSNHVRMARVIAPRAIRNGFRSVCRAGVHHGEGASAGSPSGLWVIWVIIIIAPSAGLPRTIGAISMTNRQSGIKPCFLLNPGEDNELAADQAGFRFSPDSQWLVRMQQPGA